MMLEQRSSQMRQLNKKSLTKLFGIFGLVLVIFIGAFVGNYLSERYWRNNFVRIIDHMIQMLSITSEIRIARAYMIEELGTNDIHGVFRASCK